MPRWLGIALGLIVFTFTWTSVIFTLILPRALSGPGRMSIWINRAIRGVLIAISRLARTYEGKDAILAPAGPII